MSLQSVALGIMTTLRESNKPEATGAAPLPEPRFCRELCLAAPCFAIDAYVFSVEDFDAANGRLNGYRFSNGGWRRQPVPLPDIIYNRNFSRSRHDRGAAVEALSRIKSLRPHQSLNGTLPAKGIVYDALRSDSAIAPFLPPTLAYSRTALQELVEGAQAGVIAKPVAGMQGRGVVHLTRDLPGSRLLARGRTKGNRSFIRTFPDTADMRAWLERFIGNSRFLIQPYLPLHDTEGRPFDIRTLMQKDARGVWRCTGAAARMGRKGGITSNLHGGGDAMPAIDALNANFDGAEAERLLQQIHTISGQTVNRLEKSFGRFGELAFDFGVERNGAVWLLEANAKPGREVFRLIKDLEAQRLSIERPLGYARYLFDRLAPTFTANDSANDRSSLLQRQRCQ